MMEHRVKSLMENLGDLAGLDIVLLREAGLDREADPVRGQPGIRSGWVDAVVRRTASFVRKATSIRDSRAP